MTVETVNEVLSEEQYDLLVFLEQYYLTNSGLPSADMLDSIGIDSLLFIGSCKQPNFRAALISRGVPVGAFKVLTDSDSSDKVVASWKDFALTELQLTVANAILDTNDNRSKRKKLVELGISTQQYAAWMRDPIFTGYLRSRSESLLGDSQPEAHLALLDRVRAGDMSAIKYFNELTGRYVPENSKSSGSSFDGKMLLIRVVEIMQRHLADQPQVLANIANDLIALSEGNTVLAGPNNTPVEEVHKPKAMPSISRVATLPKNENLAGSV